ncbi:MAG: dihydrodipicolinate synthase family protein [Clostridia bacterium]|nr:dihydrodipicolinate synthase family protein [Clostridia bacterium]
MDRHTKAMQILAEGTVIPATPLALKEDGSFDEAVQRRLIRYYLQAGSGGIATAVHSTQFEIRLPGIDLFERVISIVSQEVDKFEKQTGKTVVKICGVCGEKTQALSEAETAKKHGFDAVLLSPGGLNGLSERDMLERTRAVAKIMPVIGFYLQTAVGGRVFSYDYWAKLAETENVVAIKCASFNRYTTLDVVRAVALSSRADRIALYTGNDDNIIADLLTTYRFCHNGVITEKGFCGGLLGHWSVWTHKVCEIFDAIRSGSCELSEMLTLGAQITDCNSAVFDTANNFRGCIAGIHEVLRRQGLMECTRCLDPDEKLSPHQAQEIDRVCSSYPHLLDDGFVKAFLQADGCLS